MTEVSTIKNKKTASAQAQGKLAPLVDALSYLLAIPFFFLICWMSAATAKGAGILLAVVLLAAAFCAFGRLRDRISLPLLALGAFALMDALSTTYAIAGKFALYESLKVFSAFCIALLLAFFAPSGKGDRAARWAATLLSATVAVGSLVSIDLISTHFVSDAALRVLAAFSPDYESLTLLQGSRLGTVFDNPNIFAGFSGAGILLSLCLAHNAKDRRERFAHCALLAISSLAFVLCVSIGGTLALLCGFGVLLAAERVERRPALLTLMLATLGVTLVSTMLIARGSLHAWDGVDAVPLACALLGAAALGLLDRLVLEKAEKLRLSARWARAVLLALLGVAAAFAIAALSLTREAGMEAGTSLMRAAYLKPGEYHLSVDSDEPLTICIASEGYRDSVMRTQTQLLYEQAILEADFTVPEDALATYFYFSAPQKTTIRCAQYSGMGKTGQLPLDYLLLPESIASRLQGVFASHTALQRVEFFDDGMKLFHRSPIIGLGMGSFENAVKSVQPFYYETKYVHNHYIQALLETGIIGLVLFLGVFAVAAIAVLRALRKPDASPLLPALLAALTFMAAHAAVEVDFSTYACLPVDFSVIALISLCCGETVPKRELSKTVKTVSALLICAGVFTYGAMVVGNVTAMRTVSAQMTFESLETAAKMDKFEWADYLLTYVDQSTRPEVTDEIRARAAVYAERLSNAESNSIPFSLAQYYFAVGENEKAFAMLEKYIRYVWSDNRAWNDVFHLMAEYDDGSEGFRTTAQALLAIMDEWNANNLGTLVPDEEAQAYLGW